MSSQTLHPLGPDFSRAGGFSGGLSYFPAHLHTTISIFISVEVYISPTSAVLDLNFSIIHNGVKFFTNYISENSDGLGGNSDEIFYSLPLKILLEVYCKKC